MTAKTLSKRIAKRLFTMDYGLVHSKPTVGTRLAIMRKERCGHEAPLGGWCREAAQDVILEQLRKAGMP